jgi:ATP-binding cassette subfamily F protein 3
MGSLYAEQLTKSYGVDLVFADVSSKSTPAKKSASSRANGAGKSTLMRCLLGHEPLDKGQVRLSPGATVGYVEQQTGAGQATVYQYLEAAYADVLDCQRRVKDTERRMAAEQDESELARLMKTYAADLEYFERHNGYGYRADIRRVAFGLGFTDDDFPRPVATLSGGQQTRLNLARALCRKPDFLFLDEPTNHLDIAMVEWLEEFLQGYAGSVFIISHDRYFPRQRRQPHFASRVAANPTRNYTRSLKKEKPSRRRPPERLQKHTPDRAKTEEYSADTKTASKPNRPAAASRNSTASTHRIMRMTKCSNSSSPPGNAPTAPSNSTTSPSAMR